MNRPGFKTSEFWVMLISTIVTEVNVLFGMSLNAENLAAIWGPALAYIVSRGIAKMRTPSE